MSVDGWPFNRRAIAAKDAGRHQEELAILLEGVRRKVDTPYTYERAALLLERARQLQQALQVCDVWLALPEQVRHQGAATGRKIMKRRERLVAKIGGSSPRTWESSAARHRG